MVKVKVILQQAKVAQGVLGRLRPRIFLMLSTTRVVGCQPFAPAAFTPGEIPGTHFQGKFVHGRRRKIPALLGNGPGFLIVQPVAYSYYLYIFILFILFQLQAGHVLCDFFLCEFVSM